MDVRKLIERMLRASKLDVSLYEEVEADKSAFTQAIVIVVISSLAAGIGSLTISGLSGLILGTIVAVAAWFLWAYIVLIVGTKLLPEPETKSNYGELLRTIGFSAAPGVIRIIGIIPFLSGIVSLIAAIWMLIAMIIAVRQALDYKSTGRAVGVVLIGWVIQFALYYLAFTLIAKIAGV